MRSRTGTARTRRRASWKRAWCDTIGTTIPSTIGITTDITIIITAIGTTSITMVITFAPLFVESIPRNCRSQTYIDKKEVCTTIKNMPADKVCLQRKCHIESLLSPSPSPPSSPHITTIIATQLFLFELTPYRVDESRRIFPGDAPTLSPPSSSSPLSPSSSPPSRAQASPPTRTVSSSSIN